MIFIILAVVALVVVFFVVLYNGLVRSRNQVDNAWSQVDVQLKRRLDLIPNLVETVKGYASHEKSTFEAVINARNAAMAAAPSPGAQGQGEPHRGRGVRLQRAEMQQLARPCPLFGVPVLRQNIYSLHVKIRAGN